MMEARPAITPALVSELIASIYDCVLDAGRWPATLTHLRDLLRFRIAILDLTELPGGRSRLRIASGVDPDWQASLARFGPEVIEQWGGLKTFYELPLDEPAVLSRVNDPANWADNPYFVQWAKPQGFVDVLAIGLARDEGSLGSIGLGRHVSDGAIGDWEVEVARLLVPHFQRAIAIGRLLDLKTVEAGSFRQTFDALSVGVIMVDEDGRAIHANRAAHAMLAAGDPIREAGGRLALRGAPAGRTLAAAIAAMRDEATLGRRGFGLPAPFADGRPCVLHLLPLQRGQLRPGLLQAASAAVFIAPGSQAMPLPDDVLAALFDLTRMEARVFTHIAQGRTLAETAAQLGVAPATAKSHLLEVFAKTGTHRQLEIARLASSLSLTF